MYNVLIIGAGNIGAQFDTPSSENVLTHAHAFDISPNFKLVGFYDVNFKRAQSAAKLWNSKAFDNLEEAMDNIDVVCCTVPDKFHCSVLKEISAFPIKFIVAEKPITSTLEEAKEIYQIYNEKIPVQVNYSRRFIPEYRKLKQSLKNYGKFIGGTGYYGKGILHNGSHMLNALMYLLGDIEEVSVIDEPVFDFIEEDPSCEVKVKVAGGNFIMQPIDSRAVTVFEMDMFFEKARIQLTDSGSVLKKYSVQESKVYKGYMNYCIDQEIQIDMSSAMINSVSDIEAYLERKEPLKCDLNDGIKVLEICKEIQNRAGGRTEYV